MTRTEAERLRRQAGEQLIRRLWCRAYWGEMTSERRRQYARARILLDEAWMILAGLNDTRCADRPVTAPRLRAPRLAAEASGRPRLRLTSHSRGRR